MPGIDPELQTRPRQRLFSSISWNFLGVWSLITPVSGWARAVLRGAPAAVPAPALHEADRAAPLASPAPSATTPTGPAATAHSARQFKRGTCAYVARLMTDPCAPGRVSCSSNSKFSNSTTSSKMLPFSCAHEVEPPPDPRLCPTFNLHPAAATSADVGTGALLRTHDRGLMLRPSLPSLRSPMEPLGNHPVDPTTPR